MALVYRAVDNDERRWCALKVLLPEYRENPMIRARFQAEANLMRQMRHRNLIEVWDIQVDGDVPFFAMELATGGCVVDWIQQHGPMPPKMAVDVVIQVCKALRVSHEAGVVHRDVKPHNILVNRRGVCKLTDFGIARHQTLEGMTADGRGIGTIGYIAPEQKDAASSVDHAADIYSAAATLHALLRGHATMDLYLADSEPEMMEGIPEPLHDVIRKATRYRPAERHSTIADLAKDLFAAKAKLPDDSPDTPSLVMGDPDGTENEIGRFVSSTTGDDWTNEVPLPENAATASMPSITRGQLLRETPSTVEQPRHSEPTNWFAMALGSLPLFALFAMISAYVFLRVSLLQEGAEIIALQRAQLHQLLQQEQTLVAEIVELGGRSQPLEHAMKEALAAPKPQMAMRAQVLVSTASEQLAAHQPDAGSSQVYLARTVEQRLRKIAGSAADLSHSEERFARLTNDGIGRIATTTGLAPTVD